MALLSLKLLHDGESMETGSREDCNPLIFTRSKVRSC